MIECTISLGRFGLGGRGGVLGLGRVAEEEYEAVDGSWKPPGQWVAIE